MSKQIDRFVDFGELTIDGYRIDGSKVRFWASKKEANAAARAIGWPVSTSVIPVRTRFCGGYALGDGMIGLLSREGFGELYRQRNPEAA